ncbi:mitochondrial import inner membrane translocase subunit Tim29 [Plodia interpunctella]|uniref:mitochondrial import inner membrane translocase subunit Tim29 n=1 Tax=Plodia interpunctella TaxID=58824 RepID=UPI002368DAC3|nr:mitochondrial import inner membrane translocase subunit Tim29 [Plodia interpunctella]
MLRNIKSASSNIANIGTRIKLPEKFKGTIIEKWANYWKNLFVDYRQALQDLRTDIQDEPKKALIWSTTLVSMYALAKNNPTELDFQDNLKRLTNEVALVSDDCRNKAATEHLRILDMSYNQGVIHYGNLGIASVMYTSELNESCDLYKIQCPYLKPSHLSFPSRIIDVGFMGRWWNIYVKTTNYDVNE